MSRRNRVSKFKVWDNLNSATPAVSKESTVDQVDIVKYTLIVDSTVSGVLTVEFNDALDPNKVWDVLDFNAVLTINGAIETKYTILIKEHSSLQLRLNFTNAGGTGLINAWYSSTQVGA